MSQSLFSQSWYRVESLRPRLRNHVAIHRHIYRGKDWYILQDLATGKHHRFSAEAYSVVGLLDGRRTLNEIWLDACEKLKDNMPTQDEVIGLLAQLHRADLLQTEVIPDIVDLSNRKKQQQRNTFLSNLRSPMAMRFTLFDPDRFLNRTALTGRLLYGWVGILLWLGVVLPALFLVGVNWTELTSNISDAVFKLENIFVIWLVYPVVKLLHEFGHAWAVKRWGGEVHEMGVMFLVLMPVPFVDASAASGFPSRYQRMLVGASGILIELFVAGVAMLVWANVEPGAVHAVAYDVLLIAGLSTLLFNGNPLLRYDGYYVLADFLEIPNLAQRGNRFLGYLAQRYLFAIKEATRPDESPGEVRWLVSYSLCSFFYRIFIAVRIAIFVAGKFFFIGILLALWSVVSMIFMPIIKWIKAMQQDYRMRSVRSRILTVCVTIFAVLLLFICAVPLPLYTTTQGVVWVPEHAQVFVGADGFIQQLQSAPGGLVKKGAPLVQSAAPELNTQVQLLEAKLGEYQARYRLALIGDRTEYLILREEIERITLELSLARQRQSEQLIVSPDAGIFLVLQEEDLPGRFATRGSPIGYVVDFSRVGVRAIISQDDIDRVRNDTRKVEVRLAENIAEVLPSKIIREVPAASQDLPSMALSIEGGGPFALDPQERTTPQSFEKLFQFDIELPPSHLDRIGGRVFVRFSHTSEPLVFRWYRALRRLFLQQFEV